MTAIVDGKVKIIEGTPPALPAKCAMCLNDSGTVKYVDIGMDIDYYGVVYWCVPCCVEIFNALGFATDEQLAVIETKLFEKERELQHLRLMHRRFLDALGDISGSDTESALKLDFSAITEILQESVGQPSESSRDELSEAGELDPNSNQPDAKQGHSSILDITDDDFDNSLTNI